MCALIKTCDLKYSLAFFHSCAVWGNESTSFGQSYLRDISSAVVCHCVSRSLLGAEHLLYILCFLRSVSKAAGVPTNCFTRKQVCIMFTLRLLYVSLVMCITDLIVWTEEDKKDEEKNCVEKEVNTDPWPGYKYSGKLRPYYPLVWAQMKQQCSKNNIYRNKMFFDCIYRHPCGLFRGTFRGRTMPITRWVRLT